MNETEENEFGDFVEVLDENAEEDSKETVGGEQFARARMPRKGELIGKITQRYGGNRMEVITTDGKTRNCRVPGKYKRQLWLRPKDIVLVTLWEFDTEKGDIIYKYKPNEVTQLKKKGVLANLETAF
jgi:translation initiation factor 1A